VVLMARATRFLWDMPCGRKDRKMFKKAMGLLCQVIQQTGDLTLLTDGERRYGSLLFALWSQALHNGKRGRPKKTLPQGVKVRRKNKGSQRHSEAPNGQNITRPIQSLPTPPSLWLLPIFMPIIWKPSIRHCDDAVRPIEDVPICMQSRQDDSKKGEMCTGLCIISSACTLRPVKSRQWL
jgi:hypothetical protein